MDTGKPGVTSGAYDDSSPQTQCNQNVERVSFFSGLKTKAVASIHNLHLSISGLEVDHSYSGLEPVRDDSELEPVVLDCGLEPTPAEYQGQDLGPQVLMGTEEKEATKGEYLANLRIQKPNEDFPRNKIWHRATVAVISIVLLMTVVIPVSITQTRKPPRESTSIATLSKNSTSGAFKRTGLAPLYSSNPVDGGYIFFQLYTGQITQLVSKDKNAWSEESNSTVIAGLNARNGTPLATGRYVVGNITWSHLFYIDTSNSLQDLIRSNESHEWRKGTLSDLQVLASENPAVGLRATIEAGNYPMMRLYYGTIENFVQELTYNSDDKSWRYAFLFAMSNGNSGIDLKKNNSTRYMICLNSAHQMEMWWKDFNVSSVESPTHPVGVWTRGPATTNITVSQSSALTGDGFARLLYQDPSNQIIEIEAVLNAEFSRFIYHENEQDGRQALVAEPNTHIGSFNYDTGQQTSEWIFYLQTNDSNIVEYRFDDDSYTLYNTRVIYA